MMELQNLQEALKVEIQIHQVSPQPSPHTIWMVCNCCNCSTLTVI